MNGKDSKPSKLSLATFISWQRGSSVDSGPPNIDLS